MQRILNLSGGAARGAFQAGAIVELAEKGGYEFPKVYAISGGIISGYFAATQQIERLPQIWLEEIPRRANKVKWIAGAALNILSRAGGIVSSDFVEGLIYRYIHQMPENLTFRVVSLFDGREYDLSGKDFDHLAHYRRAIYAGVAVPGVFQPANIATKDAFLFDCADGGLYSPMIELPLTQNDYPLISILTHSLAVEMKRPEGIAGVAARALYLRERDRQMMFAQIQPAFTLPDPWDFRKKSISTSFQHGRQVAREWMLSQPQ